MSYNTKCQICVPYCCGHNGVKRTTRKGNRKDTVYPPPHPNPLTNEELALTRQFLHVLSKHANCNILAGQCIHSPGIATGDVVSQEQKEVCVPFLTLLYIVFKCPMLLQSTVYPSEPTSDWGIKILEASAKVLAPKYDQNPRGLVEPNPFEVREDLEKPSETPLEDGILDLEPVIGTTASQVNRQGNGSSLVDLFSEAQSPKDLEAAGCTYHTFTGEGVVRASRKFCSMSDPYEITPLTDGNRGTF